jgi:hypothetical protein
MDSGGSTLGQLRVWILIGALGLIVLGILMTVAMPHGHRVVSDISIRSAIPAATHVAEPLVEHHTVPLWRDRPSAATAHRSHERSGYAWILRQFGADETLLDRIAQDDISGVVTALRPLAERGEPMATRVLGWLSWRCDGHRDDSTLQSWADHEQQAARTLATADSTWFGDMIALDLESERKLSAACDVLPDKELLENQLTRLANDGDGASSYLLALDVGNMADMNRLTRETAIQGFPQGEMEYALDLLRHVNPAVAQSGDPTALDLLRQASATLPQALGILGSCEFQGCGGTTPDVAAGLDDMRQAASLGFPDSLIDASAQMPLSVLSADEREAWVLFTDALRIRGCGISQLNATWMRSLSESMESANATSAARQIADQYWQRYGANALSTQGC